MEIIIYLYPGMTALDAIGPYEVLRHLPGARIRFVARRKGRVAVDSKMLELWAEEKTKRVKGADLLIIPGSTIAFVREMKDQRTLDWIRTVDETTKITASVCTGSLLLASAGLLKNRKATCHWRSVDFLKSLEVDAQRQRVVEDGKYWTAAGVSAGIDLGLQLVRKLSGDELAKAIQLAIEYDPDPPFEAGNYLDADEQLLKKTNEILEEEAKSELSLWQKLSHFKTLRKLGG